MARALASKHSRGRLFAESVGLIAGVLDPFSVAAMKDIGIDIADHTPKTIADVNLDLFDLIITLTEESYAKIKEQTASTDIVVEHWPTPDPADAEGNRDQVMNSYCTVRDHLECQIADRLPFVS